MAQSARESRKTPLSIEPFWERPTSDPPIRWEKWRNHVKLAILASENITLDTLLQPKPTIVRLPAEPKYETAIEDSSIEQGERSSDTKQSIESAMGVKKLKVNRSGSTMRGSAMESLRSKMCVSSIPKHWYRGKTFANTKISHDNIYDLSTLKLWEMMEIAYIRPRNITFDRYVFFSRKQKKGETVEQFYSILKELAENCDFENREDVIIRDIFIKNMLDDDIQGELLRDTVDPERALSFAVNMELGHQNPQRISSNNGATSSTVNAIQSFNRFRGAGVRGNQSGRTVVNRALVGQCCCCGQPWTTTHRQVCPAMGKKFNHCGLLNHFTKVCRRKLNNARNTQQNKQNISDCDSSDDNYVATVENVN